MSRDLDSEASALCLASSWSLNTGFAVAESTSLDASMTQSDKGKSWTQSSNGHLILAKVLTINWVNRTCDAGDPWLFVASMVHGLPLKPTRNKGPPYVSLRSEGEQQMTQVTFL